MREASEEEFYEDFGAQLSAAERDRLLARALESDDHDLRLLVKHYVTLRRIARDALAYIEKEYGCQPAASMASKGKVSYPLGALRFVLQDSRDEIDSR